MLHTLRALRADREMVTEPIAMTPEWYTPDFQRQRPVRHSESPVTLSFQFGFYGFYFVCSFALMIVAYFGWCALYSLVTEGLSTISAAISRVAAGLSSKDSEQKYDTWKDLIEQKGGEEAWQNVDKEFFYLGESEKTEAGHSYRECIRQCLKLQGHDEEKVQNCLEDCKRRWITETSSTSPTTSTTLEAL